MITFAGHNVGDPELLFADLQADEVRHGLHDGSWTFVDAIREIAKQTGPLTDITLAVWTASTRELTRLSDLWQSGLFNDVTFMIDRSMPGRDKQASETLLELFSVEQVRVWNSHCKFCVFSGGKFDVLLLTSANLARNRTTENWEVWVDERIAGDYLLMAQRLWDVQSGQVGFDEPSRARPDTEAVVGPRQTKPKPEPVAPEPTGPAVRTIPWTR